MHMDFKIDWRSREYS